MTFTVTDTTDSVTLSTTPSIQFVTPAATGATIVASPGTVVDNGNAQATITVYLANGQGQPAAGKTVALSENGAHASISPPSAQVVTGSDGVATFTATDTSQEAVTFTANRCDRRQPARAGIRYGQLCPGGAAHL